MSDFSEIYEQLLAPFPPESIHWRVGNTNQKALARQSGDNSVRATKGQVLAYVNARDVMDRLDAVVGPENWEDSYQETSKRLLCTIRLRVWEKQDGEPICTWVDKTDGAGDTNMEGEKGGISDAFKRAAVKWGIGRYLYGLDAPWVDLDERGNIPRNFDGTKYLAVDKPFDYMGLVRQHFDVIVQVKGHLQNGEVEEARAVYKELDEETQKALWRAPSKGGILTTLERETMKGTR